MIENKELKIGKITFKHEQVNVKELYAMIQELSNLAPRTNESDVNFQEMVWEYPFDVNCFNIAKIGNLQKVDSLNSSIYSCATVLAVTPSNNSLVVRVKIENGSFAIKDYVQIVKSDEVSVYYAVIRYIYDGEQREHAEQGTEVYFALEDMSKDCVDIGSKIILA